MDNYTKLQKDIYDISELVYKNLGPGHNERVYQKGLVCELNCRNILHDSERHISVKYIDSKNNSHVLESERIDIFLHKSELYNEGNVIIELKATIKPIQEIEKVQVRKYFKELKKDKIDVSYGIIINFPQPSSKDIPEKILFAIVS